MGIHRWFSSIALIVLVTACGKRGPNDSVPCGVVGARVRTVARAEMAAVTDLPAATRADAELQLGPLENEIEKRCRDDQWSVAVRRCIADAANGAAMKLCAGALPASQRDSLPEKVRP